MLNTNTVNLAFATFKLMMKEAAQVLPGSFRIMPPLAFLFTFIILPFPQIVNGNL